MLPLESFLIKCIIGLYKEAKELLGKLLQDIEKKDLETSIAGFQLMSQIHLLEGKYIEAAGILWYTKRLDSDGKSHDKINAQLTAIERILLQNATTTEGPLRGLSQALLDQQKLKQLRDKIEDGYLFIQSISDDCKRAKALRDLYQNTISVQLKAYIGELAQDVIKQMAEWSQKHPCEYALIGLGSLAREEMTPYSDFEFAILIDSENEEDKQFFRLFTNLLHLRFINLGETILPSLDIRYLEWLFDTITPRGLSFDGSMPTACKTPLGKNRNQGGDYELIHNPQKMCQLQYIDAKEGTLERLWILQRYHLPSILATCTYVTGSSQGIDLALDYQQKVQAILNNGTGKERAFALLKDDLDHFKPNLEQEKSGRHYNVKKDLYRLPNTMFDSLANYFCLKSASMWERIEEIEEMGIFTHTAAQDLREMVMLSQEMRLSSYIKHGRQKDLIDCFAQNNKLEEFYFRSLPFASTMGIFYSEMANGSPTHCLGKERFYDNSSFYQGMIALRNYDYLKADRLLSIEILENVQDYAILGFVKINVGKYKEAEKAYQRAIQKKSSYELYINLGEARISLGHYQEAKYGDESAENAFFKAKQLAEISNDLLALEKTYRALSSFYYECGDFISARKYLKLCKENSEKRIYKKTKDPEYGVILDLDLAETIALESKILSELDNEFEKSDQLAMEAKKIVCCCFRYNDYSDISYKMTENYDMNPDKALEMMIPIFGENHPIVAHYYFSLANTFIESDYHKALEYQKKALKIELSVFGEEHPNVGLSLLSIGRTLLQLDQHKKALKYQKKALAIYLKAFGENHPKVATCCHEMGEIFEEKKYFKQALECYDKALKIRLEIFGKKHSDVADSYECIANVLEELGSDHEDQERVLEYHEMALGIRLAIHGESHSDTADSYYKVGDVHVELGNYQKGLKNYKYALKIRRKLFEQNHPDMEVLYYNIGFTYSELGNYRKALKYYQISLLINIELVGEKHPELAITYKSMADAFENLGDFENARKYYKLSATNEKITTRLREHCVSM